MAYDFKTPVDRSNTSSEKWDRYQGRDVIPLDVGDMDFRSPSAILDALHQRVDHGVFGYTNPPAELTGVALSTLQRRYGWTVAEEWLVWLPSLVCGLNVACRAVGEPGDGVMTAVPIYPPFLSAPGNQDRECVRAPMAEQDGRAVLDLERLEWSADRHVRLFLLCNPHNPVGRVYSREELNEVCEFCRKHDLVICSDEVHCGLVLDEDKKHIPVASIGPEIADRTITLMSPSKTFNIPGLSCSFAVISNPDLRRRFKRAMAGIVPSVNAMGYAAALEAYRDGRDWHRALLDVLRANRDAVMCAVSGMAGLSMRHVEATYFAWIDCRKLNLGEPAALLEEAGVGVADGRFFGGPGFLRLNFGCPEALLRQALGRMRRALGMKRPS